MDGREQMSKQPNALAIFSRGAQMLAEATTVQQTKELKDLGITAAEWARRKGTHARARSRPCRIRCRPSLPALREWPRVHAHNCKCRRQGQSAD